MPSDCWAGDEDRVDSGEPERRSSLATGMKSKSSKFRGLSVLAGCTGAETLGTGGGNWKGGKVGA